MFWNEERAAARLDELRSGHQSTKQLAELVGGLSEPSKMPWYTYSIPAEMCQRGGQLRRVPGSVCNKCYAHKGRYLFPNVQTAMVNRQYMLESAPPEWAAAMVMLLEQKANGNVQYFRWHDAGDLQGTWHLEAIVWIAKMLPHIKFWLPTKEQALVYRNKELIDTVPNLTVRISAAMLHTVLHDDKSFVTSSVAANVGMICPASSRGNVCGDCRACWDKEVINVDYPLH